jgi:hypothetical protein
VMTSHLSAIPWKATNADSEIARSRMEASSAGKRLVRGQKKMIQALGAFGPLYFTMLRPVLAWRAFWKLRKVSFTFQFFSGRGETRMLNQWLRRQGCSSCTATKLYVVTWYVYTVKHNALIVDKKKH